MCLFTYLCISFFPFSPLFVCFVAADFVFICYWPNFLLLLLFFFFAFFFFLSRRFHFVVGGFNLLLVGK